MILPLLGLFATEPLVFAPGTSPEFQGMVRQVSAALEKKDRGRAERLIALLPAKNNVYAWDDTEVPIGQRQEFAKARDAAFAEWRQAGSSPRFIESTNPTIRFRFSPELAPRPQGDAPLGVALFFYDKATPRMEAFIGLARGSGKKKVTASEVRDAVRYAIARYLGLAEQDSGVTRRPDLPEPGFGPGSPNFFTVDSNFRIIDSLVKAIKEDKPVQAGTPRIVFDPQKVEIGTVIQGERKKFSVQLTNTGDAPLSYQTQGDCGCVIGAPPGVIPAGGTVLIQPSIDSTEYVGKLVKKLIVTTNDPEKPTFEIPVHLEVKPLFRFLMPEGDTIQTDETRKTSVYLTFADEVPMNVLKANFDGYPVKLVQTAWEGELADPQMSEPTRKRKGFRFDIELEGEPPEGRATGTLSMITDNPKFRILRTQIYTQKGIVAMPDDVYLGALTATPKRSFVTLTRTSKPFKVLGIDSDNPHVKAIAEPQPNGDVRVVVEYDGKLTKGELGARLTIRTDDAKQPKILVLVRGIVA